MTHTERLVSFPNLDPRAELLPRRIFVMVKIGRAYCVPYTPGIWESIERSQEYPEGFLSFLKAVLTALRDPRWIPGSYFAAGWYRQLCAKGQDPLDTAITPEALQAFYGEEVRIDLHGTWTIGTKIITGSVLQFFLKHLDYDEALERYRIRYDLETHEETRYLHHESLPYRIVSLHQYANGLWIAANDGSSEPLRWDTLRMDAAERLYCAIGSRALPAVFADGARFSLLDRLHASGSGWAIEESGVVRPLALSDPWKWAGSLASLPPADPTRQRTR